MPLCYFVDGAGEAVWPVDASLPAIPRAGEIVLFDEGEIEGSGCCTMEVVRVEYAVRHKRDSSSAEILLVIGRRQWSRLPDGVDKQGKRTNGRW